MRILFLSGEYPPVTDGIGAYVASVAPALAARGHEIHVLSCRPGQARGEEIDRGVRVHRRALLLAPGRSRLAPVAARLSTAATCAREARRLGRFDVVEAPDWMAEGLLSRGPLVAHLHTPIGLVTRSSGLHAGRALRAADALERLAVRRAAAVTSPSRLLADRLAADGWLGGRAVRVIPYPIEPGPLAAIAPADGTGPVVLAVGRLERRKAPEVLLGACAGLGAELVFVGRSEEERDGVPYAGWLAREAERTGVRVRLVDHVAHDRLPELYAQARVVALASRFDNFPMVGLEALAAGRPLVCTDAVGTAELLAGSGAGAVVPAGDTGALAAALGPWLEDAAAAGAAGRAGRELVARECSPGGIAARREALYAEVAA